LGEWGDSIKIYNMRKVTGAIGNYKKIGSGKSDDSMSKCDKYHPMMMMMMTFDGRPQPLAK
jgi:hypothetical protein